MKHVENKIREIRRTKLQRENRRGEDYQSFFFFPGSSVNLRGLVISEVGFRTYVSGQIYEAHIFIGKGAVLGITGRYIPEVCTSDGL